MCPLAFVLELHAEGVSHELPQTDAAERCPSLGELEKIVGMSMAVFTTESHP